MAPSTCTPGAASETYEADVENEACVPVGVDAATARPCEPSSAAGYDGTIYTPYGRYWYFNVKKRF